MIKTPKFIFIIVLISFVLLISALVAVQNKSKKVVPPSTKQILEYENGMNTIPTKVEMK